METNFEPERLAWRGFAVSNYRACKVDLKSAFRFAFLTLLLLSCSTWAQDFPPTGGAFDNGFGGFGGGRGRGFGGMGGTQEKTQLVSKFDKNGDGRLNAEERKAAREYLKTQPASGFGRRGGGRGFGGFGMDSESTGPGPKVSPADVKSYPGISLYDEKTLRTVFLEFENADWEKELSDFHNTDVEVPAKMTVDGKTYNDVGVRFRGMSSYMMVPEGKKRSLNLAIDFANPDQRVEGYHSLHLLNSNGDPTLMRSVLYYHIAREYIPSPGANFMRVVINGESWGIYVNQQPFTKEFLKENFGASKGARWKVPGSPNGRGGLEYLGEDSAAYKKLYELKTKEDTNSWNALIRLCKVLNQTPADQLEAALSPILDIDSTLKYLALDNVFVNNDGYWARASDYNIYLDGKGKFHIVAHDDNETFSAPEGGFGGGRGGGRGGRGGRAMTDLGGMDRNMMAGGGGRNAMGRGGRGMGGMDMGGMPGMPGMGTGSSTANLDPLAGANDSTKPLLQKLLAVPALRAKYLGYIRTISDKWLDWNRVGPLVEQYRALISNDVKIDTRKIDTFEAFTNGIAGESEQSSFRGGPGAHISLKKFVEQRKAYLTNAPALKATKE